MIGMPIHPFFVLGVDQHFLLHLSFPLKKTAGCLLLVAWLKTCCGVAFVAPPHDWLKEAGDLELEGKKAGTFIGFRHALEKEQQLKE